VRILVVEDDPITRRVLETMLGKWGYTVSVCANGAEAWRILQETAAPLLVILDWMMPGMNGLRVCQKLREAPRSHPTYIILLTAKGRGEDIVTGLCAGADDYVTKPFDREELHARVQVGIRVLALQRTLAERVRELEDVLSRVKRLRGLLPICAYCKKIRNDRNYWEQVESYITEHSEAQFSHSICPVCYEQFAKPEIEKSKALSSVAKPPEHSPTSPP
jgi:sigma-B regulation protein RsbU (phosphoserine phosphatase)